MSVAVSGLLLLQFFWIRNVHEATEVRFDEQVRECLEKSVSDLEKIELESMIPKELFKKDLQGSYAEFVNSEFSEVLRVDESIEIRDTTITLDGEKIQFLVVQGTVIDTTTGLFAESRILTKELGDIQPANIDGNILSMKDSNSYAIQLNNSFNRQIMRKAQYLDEIMVKMFTSNYFDDISLTLNLYVLDSLLQRNLERGSLDTNFFFNITKGGVTATNFMSKSPHYKPDINGRLYTTTLFPSEIYPSEYELIVSFPNERSYLWSEMVGTLVASFLLVLIIVFAFYLSVSTIYQQKQLSEIKNDFISNMTHELKTPISTISLACEAISDPDIIANTDEETMSSYVSMIDQENKRLAKLVENVLQTSLLDKGSLNLKRSEVRIDLLLKDIVKTFQIKFKQKEGKVVIDQLDEIVALVDRIHFGNIITNLLDNALKYSNRPPVVKIRLIKQTNGFEMYFSDNGIGIKKDDQKRIFEKLYRVPTGDVHNVKGFGLGLNYVDSIVRLHGGEISVDSTLGKGSTFKIFIENE
ncbi:sensor histidine kinase [Crocinitomix algicola]|uniref:sensor histidine kinase n=1 Tax=Crocinitomix algicola TaxID=1740263 RepID=UPI0008338C7B|nr:HAMP domain-containing sensor histidine kinase [Crocinitomix algicola]